jgi:two-component system chemotaxis response regulator CheV
MDLSEKKNLLDSIDARTRLAGSNKMEILLFSLGTRETFGINVFKVREVGRTPHITRTPNMPKGVEGLISLRGNVIPVLSLSSYLDLEGSAPPGLGKTMMVAEYSKRTLGFLVHEVDRIIRVDWERVKAPETVLASNLGLITAVIELEGGHLVSILDVEQILANAFGEAIIVDVPPRLIRTSACFFADDSLVARRKIVEVLDKLGVKHKHATNGAEAWTRLQAIAAHAHKRAAGAFATSSA